MWGARKVHVSYSLLITLTDLLGCWGRERGRGKGEGGRGKGEGGNSMAMKYRVPFAVYRKSV